MRPRVYVSAAPALLSPLVAVDVDSDLLFALSEVLELEVVSFDDLLSVVDLSDSLTPFFELPLSPLLFSPGDLARP